MTDHASPRPDAKPAESSENAGADGGSLPLDVVYGILANQRRRRTLRYIDAVGQTTLGDVAEHVASLETDKPVAAIDSDERKRVYICLYQCHLPKMNDVNVVDFNDVRKVIAPGENADQVQKFLSAGSPDGDGVESARGRSALPRITAMVGRRLPGIR